MFLRYWWRQRVVSLKVFSVFLILLVCSACTRQYIEYSYEDVHIPLENNLSVFIRLEGTFENLDTKGKRLTVKKAPYHLLIRVDGIDDTVKKVDVKAIKLTGAEDGIEVDISLSNQGIQVSSVDKRIYASFMGRDLKFKHQDYELNLSISVESESGVMNIPINTVIPKELKQYKESDVISAISSA